MLKLQSVNVGSFSNTFNYDIEHQQGTGRDSTVLSIPLKLIVDKQSAICSINIENCHAENVNECLAKMAIWLRRIADGIEDRNNVTIPI